MVLPVGCFEEERRSASNKIKRETRHDALLPAYDVTSALARSMILSIATPVPLVYARYYSYVVLDNHISTVVKPSPNTRT